MFRPLNIRIICSFLLMKYIKKVEEISSVDLKYQNCTKRKKNQSERGRDKGDNTR